jgi:hypothetical protein
MKSRLCVMAEKNRGMKTYILGLSLEFVKVGGYDCPHPCDGPRNNRIFFFKRPLVDIEFDKRALSLLKRVK